MLSQTLSIWGVCRTLGGPALEPLISRARNIVPSLVRNPSGEYSVTVRARHGVVGSCAGSCAMWPAHVRCRHAFLGSILGQTEWRGRPPNDGTASTVHLYCFGNCTTAVTARARRPPQPWGPVGGSRGYKERRGGVCSAYPCLCCCLHAAALHQSSKAERREEEEEEGGEASAPCFCSIPLPFLSSLWCSWWIPCHVASLSPTRRSWSRWSQPGSYHRSPIRRARSGSLRGQR